MNKVIFILFILYPLFVANPRLNVLTLDSIYHELGTKRRVTNIPSINYFAICLGKLSHDHLSPGSVARHHQR